MNLSKLLPYLLYEFKSEHDLLQAISEISRKFTEEREKIQDYLKDPRLVSAYTAFYLTTNIPKLAAVFDWMPKDWLLELKKCEFVDIGAGPGTFSIAMREWVGVPLPMIQQIETSSIMRDQARKIWEGLYPNEKISQNLKQYPGSKFLLFGHSANEMGAKEAIRYIKDIEPENILFIEPGTKSFFPVMLEIRDYLLNTGFNVLFPCPKPVMCPMKGTSDWCHQFVQVKQSPEIERISQMAKKDRKLLPLTIQAFSKTFIGPTEKERVVRVLAETKFSFEWEVCVGEKIEQYQIQKRALNKSTIKQLENVLSGASVSSELEKQLEKSKRVKIVKLNNSALTS